VLVWLLGDLDGDGLGELAITYPRVDRGQCTHPADMLLGVHSWVLVVWGSRLAHPAGP
jgi:hypothetical protein